LRGRQTPTSGFFRRARWRTANCTRQAQCCHGAERLAPEPRATKHRLAGCTKHRSRVPGRSPPPDVAVLERAADGTDNRGVCFRFLAPSASGAHVGPHTFVDISRQATACALTRVDHATREG